MKILITGDIVGSPGREIFKKAVAFLKKEGRADFVIANAENAAGGRGLTPQLAEELFESGADVITLGDHTWDQKELRGYLDTEKRLLRPHNFAPGCPGRGVYTVPSPYGPITVVNLVGRVFVGNYDCPFRCADAVLKGLGAGGGIIVVDFHAEATSEKVVMGRYLDGRVSIVVGTHTHVQTNDARILPEGTAYITDLGMTGPRDSAIGRDLKSIIDRFLTGMPGPFTVAKGDVGLEGVVVTVSRESGLASQIETIRWTLESEGNEIR